jgi:hypothetical protein
MTMMTGEMRDGQNTWDKRGKEKKEEKKAKRRGAMLKRENRYLLSSLFD